MRKIILNIAKIKIGFAFEEYDEGFFREFDERYGAFKVDLSLEKFINVKFSKKFFGKDNRVLLDDNGRLTIKRKDFYFDGNFLFIRKDIYSFDSFLRVYISDVLNKHNGLLIHSAGVVFNDRVFLFVSKSGGGKTTITRIFSDYSVLSDELVCVLFENNKVFIYPSPFYGELRMRSFPNKKAVLFKIFLISKSNRNYEEEIGFSKKLIGILRSVVNFNKDKKVILKIFKKVEKLAQSSVSKLNFRKDLTLRGYFDKNYT